MQSNRPLIITGMPRSGIEMTATAFFNAGLYLGGPLNPPDASGLSSVNGRAGAEEIARFHDDLLSPVKDHELVPGSFPKVSLNEGLRGRAHQLLASIFRARSAWGWRDARTALMLDAWDGVVPDARWVFVVRPPAPTVWSMLVHADLNTQVALPAARAVAALRRWTAYHRAIHEFAASHADRVLLLFAPLDFEADPRALNDTVLRQWAFDLRPVDLAAVFRSYQLSRETPSWVGRLAGGYAPAQRIWRQLSEFRARQAPQSSPILEIATTDDVGARGGLRHPRSVCLATIRKWANSETFIRDHIEWLPVPVVFVHGKQFPTLTADEIPLRTRWERLVSALYREFGIESYGPWERAFRRFLKRSRVDVVLAEFGPVGAQVMDACKDAGVPLVVHFHGFDVSRKGVLDEYRDRYRKMFNQAEAFIVVSRDMERQVLALGAPRNRLFYNPCGVDTTFFRGARPDAVPPHFLCVGRFVEKKGPHLTLLAFQQVARACPEARLTMIGDGLLRAACEQTVAAMKLKDRVTFLGIRPHMEVAAHMRNTRCFIQHSLTGVDGNAEGTPVSVSEAGASGLPVVSTLHAGIKEAVIDGETGFLVPEGDVDTMAAHMIRLANDPGLAARMGARAREHICEHFSMEKTTARLWEILQDAVQSDRPAARPPPQ